jgi:hypothetical protein
MCESGILKNSSIQSAYMSDQIPKLSEFHGICCLPARRRHAGGEFGY